jgi:putative ABC transport system permease protein
MQSRRGAQDTADARREWGLRPWAWVHRIFSDLRFSVRSLCRARRFTVTVLATLVLGTGVSTLIFELTDLGYFMESPFPNPEQLYYVGRNGGKQTTGEYTFDFLLEGYQATGVFQSYAGLKWQTGNLVVGGEPVATAVAFISSDAFRTLGIRPALGRDFAASEFREGANDVIVISDAFWRHQFNARPDVLGQTVTIDQTACTVVGVLGGAQAYPPHFLAGVYRPLVLKTGPVNELMGRGLEVIARLKPGVSPKTAVAALATVPNPPLPAWAVDYLADQKPTLTGLSEETRTPKEWILLAAAAMLYAIACLNATNLMLIRLLGRRRELSIRLAIGGSRWQVLTLLAVESLGLALVASALVLGAAKGLFPAVIAFLTADNSAVYNDYWDWPTLVSIAGASAVASIAVLVLPALHLYRTEINLGLKDGGQILGEGRGGRRVRSVLVVCQTAFAVILLVGTGLMVRTFEKAHQVDLGFDPVGKVKVSVLLPESYVLKPEARLQLFERLRQRLGELPGVRRASYSQDSLFVGGFWGSAQVQMADGSYEVSSASFVSSDLQETAGLRLKEGRWLSGKRGTVEAVINETLAKARFGDRDPVGLSFKFKAAGDTSFYVVGVVRDVRETVRTTPGMHFYLPDWAFPLNINTLVLRLDKDPKKEFAGLVRRAIYQVDPRLIGSDVASIDDIVDNSMWAERYAYRVLKVLAGIALGLTVVGLYSVVAFDVNSRMPEFGVRATLGAQASDLRRLVLSRGLAATALGTFLGVVGGAVLTRFMQAILFETGAVDPWVTAGVVLLLISTSAAACWIPAQRASRVDVAKLLRSE